MSSLPKRPWAVGEGKAALPKLFPLPEKEDMAGTLQNM